MKIQEHDLFHGAALTQIVQHPSFKALNKLDEKFGHYKVNTDIRVLVKYRTNGSPPWGFNLSQSEVKTLIADFESRDTVFLCLVCGNSTICAITKDQVNTLVDLSSNVQQWIRVEVPIGGSIWLKGSQNELCHSIAHKDFPDCLFS